MLLMLPLCPGLKQQSLLCLKNSDPACKDNYRGIAVGSVLIKVFSIAQAVLDRKGGHGIHRPVVCIVQRCIVDKHCMQKKRLFCCFVGFKKAYDSVD